MASKATMNLLSPHKHLCLLTPGTGSIQPPVPTHTEPRNPTDSHLRPPWLHECKKPASVPKAVWALRIALPAVPLCAAGPVLITPPWRSVHMGEECATTGSYIDIEGPPRSCWGAWLWFQTLLPAWALSLCVCQSLAPTTT